MMADAPHVKLTLSADAHPQGPTILITQADNGDVFVNVLGVAESAGPAIAQLLIDIGTGLSQAVRGASVTAAKEQHLDSENRPARFDPQDVAGATRPKFDPR